MAEIKGPCRVCDIWMPLRYCLFPKDIFDDQSTHQWHSMAFNSLSKEKKNERRSINDNFSADTGSTGRNDTMSAEQQNIDQQEKLVNATYAPEPTEISTKR